MQLWEALASDLSITPDLVTTIKNLYAECTAAVVTDTTSDPFPVGIGVK